MHKEILANAGRTTQRPGSEEIIFYVIELPEQLWGTVTPTVTDVWLRELTTPLATDRTNLLTGAATATPNTAVSSGVTSLISNTSYRLGIQFNIGGNDVYTRTIDIDCLGETT